MKKPRSLLRIEYEKAAEAYLRSLPLEHFMESPAQATQRKITLESLDLVNADRPDVQCFNELCVQYPWGPDEHIERVVPDNMVVVHPEPIKANGSYDVPFQPVAPFWVLEYVSKSSERKDYEESFRKYERQLKVPYYLLFYPDPQEVTLFRRGRSKYVAVRPNAAGRLVISELEMEMALVDGWVRFWFRGELLRLPADLLRSERQALDEVRKAQDEARQARDQAERERQDNERLRARLRELGIEP